ncbi:MAG: lipid A biosynthesis acyltransferase [Chitinophagaceae bacterium]|nr:lipid A biosynthesis acyltransferase [Chitinophagaceae bacterium]
MYYIIYGLLYVFSLLPLWVLYLISDALYALIYHVIGYRKRVVLDNLEIAFPEKTAKERERIARRFYHNLVDYFLETLKMFSASDRFLLRHFTGNWEFFEELYRTGRSYEIMLGHTFNWEWGNYAFGRQVQFKYLGVYMRINNKVMNRLFLKMRARSGTVLLPAGDMKKSMLPHRNTQYVLALIADQSPSNPQKAYWIPFLGRLTGFVSSPERGARNANTPVIFAYIEKKRRGYYNVVFSMGEENPAGVKEGEITIKYARFMENVIRRYPDMWLWSHRRWKHSWKSGYENTFPAVSGNSKE